MVDKKKKFFVAGFWVMLAFGMSQLIRLGSNLIVTRLLEPEMFGVVAVVYVVTAGIGMFSDLGLWAFVVRHKDPTNTHMLNVVWTIQVIRGWIMFVGVFLAGVGLLLGNYYQPDFFDGVYADPRLPYLIMVAAITSVIAGYKSMASAIVSREMQMRKLEIVEFSAQLISVIVMLVWVWIYPTIWALLSAGIVSALVGTLLGYKVFPYRHKLVWDKAVVNEVFQFGKWIVISSALTYFFVQGDKLFLAGAITPTQMGVYSIALMMASLPISVTQTLAAKIIFPFLSSVVHEERALLKQRYYKIRTYLDAGTFFGVGILVALAPFIINTLYDDRYVEAGWMLQILALSVIGYSLTATSMECLSALSITKVNMWSMMVRSIGLFVGLPLFFHLYGMQGAIWVITLNPLLALPVVYWTLAKNGVFSFVKEIRMLPIVAASYFLTQALLTMLHLN